MFGRAALPDGSFQTLDSILVPGDDLHFCDKFLDHLPIERQCRRFARAGVRIAPQTLGRSVAAHIDLLVPLARLISEQTRAPGLLGTDATPPSTPCTSFLFASRSRRTAPRPGWLAFRALHKRTHRAHLGSLRCSMRANLQQVYGPEMSTGYFHVRALRRPDEARGARHDQHRHRGLFEVARRADRSAHARALARTAAVQERGHPQKARRAGAGGTLRHALSALERAGIRQQRARSSRNDARTAGCRANVAPTWLEPGSSVPYTVQTRPPE